MAKRPCARFDARIERTCALIRANRQARRSMKKQPLRSPIDFDAVLARLDRAATEQEKIDAAAGLAVAPSERQGSLL